MGYYEEVKTELGNALSDFKSAKSQVDVIFGQLEEKRKQLEAAKDVVKKMAEERQIGFPVLADAYDDFFKLQDQKLIDFLKYKDKSAIRAAEILAEYAKVRREALRNKRIAQYLVEYYESVCPFLIDLKEEVADITEEDKKLLAEYSDEELQDEAVRYLTKEEYRQLSPAERNQLALDRFWKRPKSKWLIGRLYERYVGYLYETQGYNVEYQGIVKGLEDLGRDLICHKGSSVVVIQCKKCSHYKTI